MSNRADQPRGPHSTADGLVGAASRAASVSTGANNALYVMSAGLAYLAHNVFAYTMVVLSQRLSGSAAISGGIYFALYLPAIALTLMAGVFVDIYSRRRILIGSLLWTTAVMGAAAALLTVGAIQEGRYTMLFGVALAYGLSGSFVTPARLALAGNIASGRTAERLMILVNVLQFIALGAGPGLAGWLASHGSWALVFIASGALSLGSALMVIPLREIHPQEAGGPRMLRAELRAGFRLFVTDRRLLHLCGMTVVLCLCLLGAYQVMIPELGRDVLGLNEADKGMLMLPCGLGLLLGGATAGGLLHLSRRRPIIAASTWVAAMAFGAISLATNVLVAGALLLVVGIAAGLAAALTTASLQSFAPQVYKGRIMSIYSWLLVGTSALGGLFFGSATEVVHVQGGIAAAGITAAALTAAATLGWRTLRY